MHTRETNMHTWETNMHTRETNMHTRETNTHTGDQHAIILTIITGTTYLYILTFKFGSDPVLHAHKPCHFRGGGRASSRPLNRDCV